MKLEIDIHPIQAEILNTLIFKKEARFSDLNTWQITNDHFNFHIKRLVDLGLIEKNESLYRLTLHGKEFASRIDLETASLERQAKIGVLIVCMRTTDGEPEFLIHERTKQPYFGYRGFHTMKVRKGETFTQTALRCLQKETGLTGTPKVLGFTHKLDTIDGELVEDRILFIVKVTDTDGELIADHPEGKNTWMNLDTIAKLQDRFGDVEDIIEAIVGDVPYMSEVSDTASGY